MSALMYGGQDSWSSSPAPENLWANYAAAAGADVGKWRACMSDRPHRDAVSADRQLGLRLGVDATPTIFVGRIKIVGVGSYENLAGAVRASLRDR